VITNTIHKIIHDLENSKSTELPNSIDVLRKNLNSPYFDNSSQHDAMEFLTTLLGEIHSELNTVKNPIVYHQEILDVTDRDLVNYYIQWAKNETLRECSLVNDVFSGDLMWELRCGVCAYRKYSFEKFGELVLNLVPTENEIPHCPGAMAKGDLYLDIINNSGIENSFDK
jgi:ubiquitin C-terminal hydrolase